MLIKIQMKQKYLPWPWEICCLWDRRLCRWEASAFHSGKFHSEMFMIESFHLLRSALYCLMLYSDLSKTKCFIKKQCHHRHHNFGQTWHSVFPGWKKAESPSNSGPSPSSPCHNHTNKALIGVMGVCRYMVFKVFSFVNIWQDLGEWIFRKVVVEEM